MTTDAYEAPTRGAPITEEVKLMVRQYHPLEMVLQNDYGVQWDQSSKGSVLRTRCPLNGHEDSNPSFVVFVNEQRYHCFGGSCPEPHGDLYNVIENREDASFIEAFWKVAEREAMVSTPVVISETPRLTEYTVEHRKAMRFAGEFYHGQLAAAPRAKSYLAGRGVSSEAFLRQFRIGYAAGGLLAAAQRRSESVSITALQEIGLLNAKRNERMWGRVIIPDTDASGVCYWLLGRDIRQNSDMPTYLNADGPKPLFGARYAANNSRREVFVVEGAIDWLAFATSGAPAVAILGNGDLSAERIRFFGQFDRIYLAFDNDDAGKEFRATYSEAFPDKTFRVVLPHGYNDPGTLLQEEGRPAVQKFVDAVRAAVSERLSERAGAAGA